MKKHIKNQLYTNEPRRNVARRGEEEVCTYLKNNGYTILMQNYRTRSGEIDIIAQKKNLISFIEVKTRSSDYFSLSQVVTHTKQIRIMKATRQFLQEHTVDLNSYIIRFDVALVHTTKQGLSIDFIHDAFTYQEGDF